MHKILCQVAVLGLVHTAVVADEMTRFAVEEHVLHDCLISAVYILLRVLADVDIAEAAGRALAAEHRVKYERIQSVLIPAGLCRGPAENIAAVIHNGLCLVLGGEKRLILSGHEFAVVQHIAPALPPFVVPVDHDALPGRIHAVVVDILCRVQHGPAELSGKLRILRCKQIVVAQAHVEEIAAVLYVSDAAFPEEVYDIRLHDVYIAQAIELPGIPEHSVYARPGDELIVHNAGIDALEVTLVKNDRHHG